MNKTKTVLRIETIEEDSVVVLAVVGGSGTTVILAVAIGVGMIVVGTHNMQTIIDNSKGRRIRTSKLFARRRRMNGCVTHLVSMKLITLRALHSTGNSKKRRNV